MTQPHARALRVDALDDPRLLAQDRIGKLEDGTDGHLSR